MSEPNDMPNAINPLIDVGLNLAEVGLDTAIDEGILRDIPLIGSLAGMFRFARSIPDLLLRQKVSRFILQLGKIPQDKREQFNKKMDEEPELRHKVSATIMLLLDSLNDLEKAEILGVVFRAYIAEEIDLDTFRRLGQSIDAAFVSDLNVLTSKEYDAQKYPEATYALSVSGLTRYDPSLKMSGGIAVTRKTLARPLEPPYEITGLGEIYKKIIRSNV